MFRKSYTDFEICELKQKLKGVEKDVDTLLKEREELIRRLNGGRVVDCFCTNCENLIQYSNWINSRGDFVRTRLCLLDCGCKDFAAKESARCE